jgi:2-alkyl-3-oxoalkanoate reductase
LSVDCQKSVLVTGAAGFIGGACIREFLVRGWRVTALVHRKVSPGLHSLAEAGRLSTASASIEDGPALFSAVSEAQERQGVPFSSVVHCAGLASDIGRDKRFRRTNFEGTRNIAACVGPLSIGRLVFVSTTDVYGLHDFESADEETDLSNNRRNPYPKYKILAEEAIRHSLPPTSYVILRPGAVWGPGDTTILPRILNFLRSTPVLLHFGKWHGSNRWPLCYIRNVAVAAYLASSRDGALGEAFNILDSERTSIEEFYRMLLRVKFSQRQDMKSLTLPFCAGWVMGVVSTRLSNAFRLDHPLVDPSLYGLYAISRNLDFSNRKMLELFRSAREEPISRERALAEFREWANRQTGKQAR